MITLDEAKILAQEVLNNTTRSHVQAAKELAEFVLSLYYIDISKRIKIIDRANEVGTCTCIGPSHYESCPKWVMPL